MAPAADAGPILCRAEGLCHAYAGRRAKGRRGGTEGVGPARGGGEGGGRRSGSEIGSGAPALRGVDLELRAGTLTAVVGANGSGKTTLLRILAGNLAPAGGRVSLFGVESPATATVAVRRRLLRRLSYLGQDLALDPEMSGLETLELLAVLCGLRGPRRVEIEAEIERFGLAEPVARPVAQWSGGQRRRLHLAGSLLVGADLLLADEPSAGLDRKGEERLWRLLESRAEGGAAVVVVSHDLARVARHAHRVVELEAGRITAQGPPAEVLAQGGLADEVPAAEAPPPEPAESSSAADEVGTSGCREEGSLPAAWPVAWALCRRTWTKTLRRPVTLTFSLVQPLVWMAFFGFLFQRYPLADLGTTRYLDFLAPGVCAMTVLFGASQSGIGWIRDHQTGFLGRLLHTPASPSAILAGKVLADVLRLLVQATAALLLALALGAELRPGPNLVPGMVGLALFAAGFSSLSCAIALRTRAQETMATFVHLVNMPLLFTSTALVPRRQMPDWLGRVAEHNPLSHAVETVRAPLLYGQEPAPASLLLLTLFATLLFTLARHETHRLYHGGS